MKTRLFALAGLTLVLGTGVVAQLWAESISQLTPVATIDLGTHKPTEKTPVVSSVALSPTAGQMATLRAQEEDMLRNRQLSAIGLGGELSGQMRGQDLQFRGQDLSALQGDQSTALGARGQDLQGAMANQSTQTALEQLRAQTALGARGQDLGALQSDQATQAALAQARGQLALGARGQDAGMLQAQGQLDLGARGQDLGALQGDQATALGARGQDLGALTSQLQAGVQQRGQDLSALQGNQATQLGLAGIGAQMRGQDLGALQGDQSAALAAQDLALRGQLGLGGLGLQAQGQGLDFASQANQQALAAEGMAQAANQGHLQRANQLNIAQQGNAAQQQMLAQQLAAQPGMWEQILTNSIGGVLQGGAGALMTSALSDERAKVDIKPIDLIGEHLRGAPGYSYRYQGGLGEDPDIPHVGPMAQDLESGPFGAELVETGADGYKRVRVDRMPLVNHAALAQMRRELDDMAERLQAT